MSFICILWFGRVVLLCGGGLSSGSRDGGSCRLSDEVPTKFNAIFR